MPMLTEKTVDITVLVYKDGLAAVFGHDLKLKAHALVCTVSRAEHEPFSIHAVVDARQIRVECAREHGHDVKTPLTASDQREINNHIQDDVLHTERFPEIAFTSTRVAAEDENFLITGNLTMTGHTHQLHVRLMRRGEHYVASVHLNQTEYGIKPFSAAFGALKVKPEVVVEVVFPADLATRA